MTAQNELDSSTAAAQTDQNTHKRAYFRVFICILVALYQIIYAFRVLQLQDTLGIRTSIPSLFDIGMSAAWAIGFCAVSVALMRWSQSAKRIATGLMIGFVAFSLLRLALFAQADYDRSRLPFLLLFATICLFAPLLSWLKDVWRTIYTGRGF